MSSLSPPYPIRARPRPAAIVLLSAGIALGIGISPASAVVRNWATGSGVWSTPANWAGGVVPLPADTAVIGTAAVVQDAVVNVNSNVDVNWLAVVNGYTVRLNGVAMDVADTLNVAGTYPDDPSRPTTLIIHDGTPPVGGADPVPALTVDNLNLTNGAELIILDTHDSSDGIALSYSGDFVIDESSTMFARGTITHGSNDALLRLNGTIEVVAPTYIRGGGNDLDGASNTGRLLIRDTLITRHRHVPEDPNYDGEMTIFSGGELRYGYIDPSGQFLYASPGFFVGTQAEITMLGVPGSPAPRIDAPDVLIAGSFHVDYLAEIETPDGVTFDSTADVTITNTPGVYGDGVFTKDGLLIKSPVEIIDSAFFTPTFRFEDGSTLRFEEAVSIGGGNFITESGDLGRVVFENGADWHGDVTAQVRMVQQGTATVSDVTEIDADHFILGSPSTEWTLNDALTVNAVHISNGRNRFRGTFNIGGATDTRLTLNILNPDQPDWEMSGTMNLEGVLSGFGSFFFVARLDGSPMELTGDLVVHSRVRSDAPITFAEGSEVEFVDDNSMLRLAAGSHVEAGTQFTGDGMLHNGTSATMTLETGLSMGQVGIANFGRLELTGDLGLVATASFENVADTFSTASDATLVVDVTKTSSGVDSDELLVTLAEAVLAGVLEPSIVNVGPDFVAPGVGDQFTILTAPAGIEGTFEEVLDTHFGGLIYEWLPIYEATEVHIQVAAIGGLPGDFNGNGTVENADLTLLLNNWSEPVPPAPAGWVGAPLTAPAVDNDELTALLNNWANMAGAGASAAGAVPEPHSLLLLLGAASVLSIAPRRRLSCFARGAHTPPKYVRPVVS